MAPPASLDELYHKAQRLELRSRQLARARYAGLYRSAFKGQGIEFADVREYAPGDDVRRVDWNVSARHQSLYVKTMNEERDRNVLVVLDTAASLGFGTVRRTKLDLALELASLLTLAAFCARDRVSLALVGSRLDRYVPPRKGWNHTARLVREMVAREASGAPPAMEQVWRFLESPGVPRSLALVVIDFHVAIEPSASLRAAARKHELVALLVSDPREWSLPSIGLVRLRDPATGEVTLVQTGRAAVRAEFERTAQARRAAIKHLLSASGVECAEFSTAEEAETGLRRFLSARVRRGYRRR
jgi:uncharacterized protein (DUF58 family)